jgi:hypothetical protein
MFLGHSVLGYDSDVLYKTALLRRKFATTTFYGDAILDNVHCMNMELTREQMDAVEPVRQLWKDSITNWLSNFQETLKSGNMDTDGVPIDGWILKRKRVDEQTYTLLKSFPATQTQFADWTVANDIEYEYSVHALSGTVESNPTVGTAYLDFDGWNLTDGESQFMFWINLKSSQIPTVVDRTVNDNYTEYSTVSYGKRKYKQGSIETMPLTYNGNKYISVLSVLKEIDNFINNRKIKLLKNPKGEIWWVDTFNFSHTYSDGLVEIPYTISFEWMEIGNGQDPFVGGAL